SGRSHRIPVQQKQQREIPRLLKRASTDRGFNPDRSSHRNSSQHPTSKTMENKTKYSLVLRALVTTAAVTSGCGATRKGRAYIRRFPQNTIVVGNGGPDSVSLLWNGAAWEKWQNLQPEKNVLQPLAGFPSLSGMKTKFIWLSVFLLLLPILANAQFAKPAVVSRTSWGCPDGQNSPAWTPQYTTVTHLVVHH